MSEEKDSNSPSIISRQGSTQAREADQLVSEVVQNIGKLPQDQQQLAIAKLEMYSGPIPHPDILSQYEKIDPGAAKLIIDNGVEESRHRRELESQSLEYTRRDRRRRDWMGFVIALVIIGIGAFLIEMGHVVSGSLLSGASALGIVGLFLNQGVQSEAAERTRSEDSTHAEEADQ